jgi:hypothetical protein
MKRVVFAGLILIAGAAVALLWFQPQKLFIDETVDEAAPTKSMTAATAEPTRSGSFRSLAHTTTGTARVTGNTLRLEDLKTDNGPDVVVWLSAGDEGAYADDFVDLGSLKGNKGNQNYVIPDGTDLDRYDTVVIWCRRFTVGFGAAELSSA